MLALLPNYDLILITPGYMGLAKFILIDQYVNFPWQGCNISFTDAEIMQLAVLQPHTESVSD